MSNVKVLEHDAPSTELALPSGNALTPMDMLDRAISTGANIDVLTKLMDLQERWEKNRARKAFDAAMAAAKAEIPVILKNRTVDYSSDKGRTHYRHEDLAEIARTIDPLLAKHGLSYRFRTTSAPNEPITVTCIVSHRGGHSEENTLSGARDDSGKKNPLQMMGSAITYLQRYTLKAALGLAASTDDDAKSSEAPATINEEQIARLQRLIMDYDAELPKVLAFLKVEALADLHSDQFDKAVLALEQWAKRAGKAK